MLGYLCAYYRYYYPIEFVCALLNISETIEDTVSGSELAKLKGIKIEDIRFGYSRAKYSIDKENNKIYKGMASIKFLNEVVSEELYVLSQNKKYDNIIDVFVDLKNSSANTKQIKILISLNFFSEFGGNKKLLQIYDLFENLYSRKQIKIDDIDKLGINIDILEKYSNKKTEKLYKELDMSGYVKEVIKDIPNKSLNIKEQLMFEKEYLGSPVYTNNEAPETWYFVEEFKIYKNPNTPYLKIYNINTSEILRTKITKGSLFQESPFQENSVIDIISFRESFKKKRVGEEWVSTDELEYIIDNFKTLLE